MDQMQDRYAHFVVLKARTKTGFHPVWVHKEQAGKTYQLAARPLSDRDLPTGKAFKQLGMVSPWPAKEKPYGAQEGPFCLCTHSPTWSASTLVSQPEFLHYPSLNILSMGMDDDHTNDNKNSYPNFIRYNFTGAAELQRAIDPQQKENQVTDFDICVIKHFEMQMANIKMEHPMYQLHSWQNDSITKAFHRYISDGVWMRMVGLLNEFKARELPVKVTVSKFYPTMFNEMLNLLGVDQSRNRVNKNTIYLPQLGAVCDRVFTLEPQNGVVGRYHETEMTGTVYQLWCKWACKEASVAQLENARWKLFNVDDDYRHMHMFRFQCTHRIKIIQFILFANLKFKVGIQHMVDYLDLILKFNGHKDLIWLSERIDSLCFTTFGEGSDITHKQFFDLSIHFVQ